MVLETFMIKHNIEQAIYLDSDVLVYDNLNNWLPKFTKYGMSIVGVSGHTNFIQSIKTLSKFNEYIFDKYSSNEGHKAIQQWWDEHMAGKADHGISDMDMLVHFALENPAVVIDLEAQYSDFVFDRSFSESNGFEIDLKTGFKKVVWKEDNPYLASLKSGKEVPAITLHFQGNIKQNQKTYMPNLDFNFKFWNSYFKLRYILFKLERKVLRMVN